MAGTVVLGMQWGDEGKGKIVDLLCPAFDVVARFQGGHNAGHTVKFGDRHYALHLIPSGILHPESRCVLGNGMVINPEALFEELDGLAEMGVDWEGRLLISKRAHVLLPLYAELDQLRERARGEKRIGTTARGIGPAYEYKASRSGLRMGDLTSPELENRLRGLLLQLEREIESLGGQGIGHPASVADECREWADRLLPMLADTEILLNRWLDEGKSVLFEGAQGSHLDLDFGTFPFVTSSNSTAGGAAVGTGVAPHRFDGVIGVLKAYTTRVGEGPFTTELDDADGEALRHRGNEYGTTTGRPRRCGWLDCVSARHSRMVSGVDTIALTKLDVLDQLDEIQACVAYEIDGERVEDMPSDLAALERAVPVYETLPGWGEETVGALTVDDLPQAARDYVAWIEEHVGAPVGLISTGPRREETIVADEPHLARLTGNRLATVRAARDAG